MQLVEIDVPASVAGAMTSAVMRAQVPYGEFARFVDVRGSFQTDATVQNRVVGLQVSDGTAGQSDMVFPATPVVPAGVNVNTLWQRDGAQSVSASPLSSPGHVHGAAPQGLMTNVVEVNVFVNNVAAGDVIGVHRMRLLMGKIEEFEC